MQAVERAVDRGDFARLDPRAMLVAGLVLGVAAVLLVLFAG